MTGLGMPQSQPSLLTANVRTLLNLIYVTTPKSTTPAIFITGVVDLLLYPCNLNYRGIKVDEKYVLEKELGVRFSGYDKWYVELALLLQDGKYWMNTR
jgi:hypothetical protein